MTQDGLMQDVSGIPVDVKTYEVTITLCDQITLMRSSGKNS